MMHHSQQRGFGLLEVVIASGILAMVVGAATSLIRSSLRRTALAADRSAAMNLAQEGIEQVRSARDSLYIDQQPNSFEEILPINGLEHCDDDIAHPTCGHLEHFTFQPGSGWIIKEGKEPILNTIYTREVYITAPTTFGSPDDSKLIRKIHVIVRWDNDNQAVESETYLTNWRSGT
jgi:prepilin-type N-terminal cleavage/methylation domain-containing protein